MNEPLVFSHVYSSAPWGGRWINAFFGRTDAPEVCSESWEISGHPFGMSVVTQGTFAGRTLASLADEFGEKLVGTKAKNPKRFPLLLKLLDARRSLSVQVHPNEKTAPITGGEPKTEAWVVLAAAPGAALYAGVKPGVTEEILRAAAEQGEALVGLLQRHEVKAGDVLYIPGGVIHAIGAGCLIYEVQQSSDTTYRLYDWDRVDAYGRGRPLHLKESFASIDYSFPPVRVHVAGETLADGANIWHSLVHSPFFTIRALDLADEVTLDVDGSTCICVFAQDGGVKIKCEGGATTILRGSSALVPASAGTCTFNAVTSATKLLIASL